MRLRNLLMILLLCMTVGVLGTSCTGDDGEAGPPGPPGPKGDPGESASPEETTGLYDFLKTWGSETGEISCDDPILRGMGMFPGPDALKPLVNNAGQPAPVAFEAQCSSTLFDEIPASTPALMAIPGISGLANAELILIKTGAAMETNKDNPEVIPSTEVSLAKTVVSTKHFAGGVLAADMSTKGGNDEVFDRMSLHSDCKVGTAPGAIAGEWRSVHIEKVTTPHNATTREAITASATTDITRKICIRLDSLPGVVKCFIEMNPTGNENTVQQIALYDADGITTVVMGKDEDPTDDAANDKLLPPVSGTATAVDAANSNSTAAQAEQEDLFGMDLSLSDVDTERLCHLFEEGGLASQ